MKKLGKQEKGNQSRVTRLYPREKLMLQGMSQGKTPTEAAAGAYNVSSIESARQIASKVLKRDRFIQVLENAGLSDGKLAKKYVELMDATRPVVVDHTIHDYPDYPTQRGTLRDITRIKGYLKDDQDGEANGEPLVIKAIQFVNGDVNVQNNQK